jgi:hypothetical protein
VYSPLSLDGPVSRYQISATLPTLHPISGIAIVDYEVYRANVLKDVLVHHRHLLSELLRLLAPITGLDRAKVAEVDGRKANQVSSVHIAH